MKTLSIIVTTLTLMTCFAFNAIAQTNVDPKPQCIANFPDAMGSFNYDWKNTPYEFTIDANSVSNGDTIGTLLLNENVTQNADTRYPYAENTGEMIIISPENALFSLSAITRTQDTSDPAVHTAYDIASTLSLNTGNRPLTQDEYSLTIAYQAYFDDIFQAIRVPDSMPELGWCLIQSPTVTVTINVLNAGNVDPVFAGPTRELTVKSGTAANTLIGTVTATDPGDTLTYSTTGLTRSDLWELNSSSGQFTTKAEIPHEDITDTFTLTATDSEGATGTISVTIRVTNDPPFFDPPSTRVLRVNNGTAPSTNVGSPITATDPNGGTLTYSATPTRSDLWGVDSSTGQFSTQARIPNTAVTDTFQLIATDPQGATASINVTITINTTANDSPYFDPPGPIELRVAGGTARGIPIGDPIVAIDPDGDTITYGVDPISLGYVWSWKIVDNKVQFSTTTSQRTTAGDLIELSGPIPNPSPVDSITVPVQITADDGNGGKGSIIVNLTLYRDTTNPGPTNPGPTNPGPTNPGTTNPSPTPIQLTSTLFGPLCYTVTYNPQRFGPNTPHVFISAIEAQIDVGNRNTGVGIYSPVAIEIYVSPEEGRLDLDGWKLELGIPYTPHKEYPLTTENSVIVDNVVRITNEDVVGGIPMVDSGFTGTEMPFFSYRLSDPENRQIDLTFSCYYQGNVFQKLSEMENPRLERLILGTPGRAVKPEDYSFQYGLLSQWHPANNPLGSALAAPPARRPGKTAAIWAEFRKQ